MKRVCNNIVASTFLAVMVGTQTVQADLSVKLNKRNILDFHDVDPQAANLIPQNAALSYLNSSKKPANLPSTLR